jgi:hypothetical protein
MYWATAAARWRCDGAVVVIEVLLVRWLSYRIR